ncbi:MAG: type I-E CRISPR-associated protein Cas5/CasD [Gammaproteobacteria bacterium]|nr:type I-E CRISPR-associated protein Cas5/CasD [Gammaproteobacteria bacterium]MBU1962876.1 type I-E CRISPR-associated protein Cas5/CasD [Gammaproteobacteria bacterium]
MPTYLILKLEGPMQAWGGHTFEDYRPTQPFPTRSGILGLLGACLGIERGDREGLIALGDSFRLAVRADADLERGFRSTVITDFHTVEEARKVDGSANKNPVVSRREYLCDAAFTAALEFADGAARQRTVAGLRRPRYTPFLGRRSCPLSRPLYEAEIEADSLRNALAQVPPHAGVIYSEDEADHHSQMAVRDVPLPGRTRRFATRRVYIRAKNGGNP